MTHVCRLPLLLMFSLFWGGLTFYTGFVVRISHDVLSDPMDGGLITQRVTGLLQILGAVTCVIMFWNAAVTLSAGPALKRSGRVLFCCALILASALAGLFIVHGHLDAVIDGSQGIITDREAFTVGHRRYNQLTTVEWICCLVYLPVALQAWRTMDVSA